MAKAEILESGSVKTFINPKEAFKYWQRNLRETNDINGIFAKALVYTDDEAYTDASKDMPGWRWRNLRSDKYGGIDLWKNLASPRGGTLQGLSNAIFYIGKKPKIALANGGINYHEPWISPPSIELVEKMIKYYPQQGIPARMVLPRLIKKIDVGPRLRTEPSSKNKKKDGRNTISSLSQGFQDVGPETDRWSIMNYLDTIGSTESGRQTIISGDNQFLQNKFQRIPRPSLRRSKQEWITINKKFYPELRQFGKKEAKMTGQ